LKPFLKFQLVYSLHGIVAKEDSQKPELSYFYRLRNRYIERSIFRDASRVLAFNEQLAETAVKEYKSNAEIKAIPPGIDEVFFSSQRKLLNLTGVIEIIMLGGFPRREDAAYEILPILSRYGNNISVTLVGFKNQKLREDCTDLKINYVVKTGQQEWSDRLSSADIFIAPYRHETFSLSGIEAMAAECVPVFCNSVKAAELVIDGKNGFLYSPDDLSSLAEIIAKLIKSPTIRYQSGHDARKAVSNFRWEKLLPIHIAVYHELTER
jgi:glycosyltransferase involved in cell wall biosynthesis